MSLFEKATSVTTLDAQAEIEGSKAEMYQIDKLTCSPQGYSERFPT